MARRVVHLQSERKGSAMATLRSDEWYAGDDRNAYIHRAWMRRGVPGDAFTGRPQIAIANTASDLTPCNAHLGTIAESVKHGIYEAGGIPLELPVVSLGETQVRPTAMLWRGCICARSRNWCRRRARFCTRGTSAPMSNNFTRRSSSSSRCR